MKTDVIEKVQLGFNFVEALSNSQVDQATKNAIMALAEQNSILIRKLTELQDHVLGSEDDRAEYDAEFDEPNDIWYLVNRRKGLTARMQSEQSNLPDEGVEKDIRLFIGENQQLLTQLEKLFSLLGAKHANVEVIRRLSLDDIIDMMAVEITRNAIEWPKQSRRYKCRPVTQEF